MKKRQTAGGTAVFPGGSKSRVNRAGDAVRSGTHMGDDLLVIEQWRAAHRGVLNTFQAVLRGRAKGRGVTVAQRHKRRRTIFEKLRRFPKMQLSRMDDVAGCRLIFKTVAELYRFRREFHGAPFNHKLRNEIDKYDYIKHPNPVTGYRGVHDVYEYDVKSEVGKPLAGLYVEIQYRTLVQHSWATAVEVIGFITESQPKFQQGDRRFIEAMALASEILARSHEDSTGPHPGLSNATLVRRFLAMDKELGLLQTLRGLSAADGIITAKRNAILIFSPDGTLSVRAFRDATDALRELFALERQMPDQDIVLVRADTTDEVRLAFKNYFSDARDFIKLIEEGCARLSDALVVSRTGHRLNVKRSVARHK
jgi:ppGpp synthetase/RelA/SpoT-type nucleotidyltranferase